MILGKKPIGKHSKPVAKKSGKGARLFIAGISFAAFFCAALLLVTRLNKDANDVRLTDEVPEYVISEANDVAGRVRAAADEDSIVFIAISDTHYYGQQQYSDLYADTNGIQNDEGNLHAAMAVDILTEALDVDFFAHMGDVSWGSSRTTTELTYSQIDGMTELLDPATDDIPVFYAVGNHDSGIYYHLSMTEGGADGIYTADADYIYENFTARSAGDGAVIAGEECGGYCYRDFAEKKLRVFLLNTSETLVTGQADKATSPVQRRWFADALMELNSKPDAAEWSFIVLSHYPADYGGTMPLSELIKAYVNGEDITIGLDDGQEAHFSFAGNNSAGLVAQFHGHVHNMLMEKLSVYQGEECVEYDAWRVGIPNAQYNRENYYTTVGSYTEINFSQEKTYAKQPDSGSDTAFTVNVIDPSENTLYSFCYGAGIDRVLMYGGEYGVAASLDRASVIAGTGEVKAGERFTAELVPDANLKLKNVRVYMNGEDITDTCYADGMISIAEVTGDIEITAEAGEKYTDQLHVSRDAGGNIFGYRKGYRLNSDGIETVDANSYVTGYIPAASGDVIYMKNVHFEKENSGILSSGMQRIVFYDSSHHLIGMVNAAGKEELQKRVYDGNYLAQFTVMDTMDFDAADVAYIRLNAVYIGDDSIITVNEPIE